MREPKPLGRKNYGSISHLPDSRMGPGDHKCHEGQARIATIKKRDKHDEVIVQEKLDGSNVGVARIGDSIFPIGRAGYLAISSPHMQHRYFSHWAYENQSRFMKVLEDGERLVGEWILQAHGTKYNLIHEPFIAFDIMTGFARMPYDDFVSRIGSLFVRPELLHRGEAFSIVSALNRLETYGFHGAQEQVEGAVWRVERNKATGKKGDRKRVVDFLTKYVRPEKVDGKYLDKDLWNKGAEAYMS